MDSNGDLLTQLENGRCCYLCQTAMVPNFQIVPEGITAFHSRHHVGMHLHQGD